MPPIERSIACVTVRGAAIFAESIPTMACELPMVLKRLRKPAGVTTKFSV